MSVKQSQYEESLANYSDHVGAIALLKQYRPYLEMIPSMRRPMESVMTIPLPIIRIRSSASAAASGISNVASGEVLRLPCDVAILMCDPEWKIKTGAEIFVFISRPQEDFSDLLSRWRQTQIWLDKGYEWIMPSRYQHILSEGADKAHPLFILFSETPERVKRGLRGAHLPFVTQSVESTELQDEPLADIRQPLPSDLKGDED
ncbi:MAG TPA: hypothetical protein V6C78_32140 [Crinalium sp.]|jgi:hypothetical protein